MNFNRIERVIGRGSLLHSMLVLAHFSIISGLDWVRNGHFITRRRVNSYIKRTKGPKMVNFGAGDEPLKGFMNTGIPGRIHINIAKRLPIPDNSFDLVLSSHVIEHVYQNEFARFLKETYRILKPGGIQIICTPSMEKCSRILYCNKSEDSERLKRWFSKYTTRKVTAAYLLQGLSHMYFHHKFLYDREEMEYLAENSGFKHVEKMKDSYCGFDLKGYLARQDRIWKLITDVYVLKKQE